MKRILSIAALFVALMLPGLARAQVPVCTCVATSTAATKILAANDLNAPRKMLCIQNTSTTAADYMACNVGNTTAVTIATGIILPAQSATSAVLVPPFCFPPVQVEAQTFPVAPSGQVNCIAAAGTPTACACDY